MSQVKSSCERFHFVKFEAFEVCFMELITFIALEKCEKECNMPEIILVRCFCPLKIKITQFP